MSDIIHEDCQDYIDFYIEKNNRPEHKRSPDAGPMFAAVKKLMSWYADFDVVEKNPTAKITLPARREEYGQTNPITLDDVWEMVEIIDQEKITALELKAEEKPHKLRVNQWSRDRCLILTLTYTGLRISALLGTRVSDIIRTGDGHGALRVCEKGEVYRNVPLIPLALSELDLHMEICGLNGTDYLFQRLYRGDVLSGNNVTRRGTRLMLIERAKAANVKAEKITNHTFRATFGTHYLRAGADINQVKRMLGHKSTDTTSKYDHRDEEELSRDIAAKMTPS